MKKLLVTGIMLGMALLSKSAIITVTNTNDSGAGSFRQAVTSSLAGDVIDFSVSGTIILTSGEISLTKDITISGPGATVLTISGNNSSRIFNKSSGTVIINDLTLFNGRTGASGGAINLTGSGSLTINRCTFLSNNCTYDGGGILLASSTLNLFNCTFQGNHAPYDGGGIRINGGTALISGCTFTGNSTGFSGAGIRRVGGSVSVVNTTLSGNIANMNGGGFEGVMTFRNCTITNNHANSGGGGGKASGATLMNCIVYGNTAGSGPDIETNFTSNGVNIIGTLAGSTGASGADIIGIDPLLGPLAFNGGFTNTHSIPLTSIAINAGSACCGAPNVDQCGSVRICAPDIGAFENVAANYSATGTDTQSSCNNFTWIDGVNYTSSNTTATYTLVGAATNGCDSIVTLNLTINNPTTGTDTQSACNSFTWIDGVNYTSSNTTATHTLVGAAANGCDSIVTLNLTINNPTTGTDTQSACNSFTWIDGVNYTSSNTTATHTLVGAAANGCDSIVTLNLTINNPTTVTDTQSACNSFTWIDGVNYTSSNTTATHTLVGAAASGCDSIVTLNLTINNPTTGTDTQSACNSFTWIDGVNYTSNNTTATYTIVGGAANGCDSIVTLNLTIQSPPVVSATSNGPICEGGILNLNATSISGETYQWTGPNGFTSQIQNPVINVASSNNTGTYEVTVSTGNNCTNTAQISVSVNPLPILNSIVIDDSCASNIGQITVETISPNMPLTFLWSDGSTTQNIEGLSEGTFEVVVTDALSCSSSASVPITNNKDNCACFVYVANAFSPNGDGNNDLLFVRGDCVITLIFKVFNQWGNLVFESHKLKDGWDGTYQGELQNTSVFVYTIEAVLENGEKINESGDINLIR